MGCCESNDRETSDRPDNAGGTDSKRISNFHLVSEPPGEKLVGQLVVLKEDNNFQEILALASDNTLIDPKNNFLLKNREIKTPTVGCLSLAILKDEIPENCDNLAEIIESNAEKLLKCMHTLPGSPFATSFLYNLINASDKKSLKKKLVNEGIFQILITMMNEENPKLRRLAAVTADVIYRNYPKLQKEFLDCKGGWNLIQLLKRQDESHDEIELVFDVILDLVLDKQFQPVPENIQRLLNTNSIDVINGLDTQSVIFMKMSEESREKLKSIVSLLPSQDKQEIFT